MKDDKDIGERIRIHVILLSVNRRVRDLCVQSDVIGAERTTWHNSSPPPPFVLFDIQIRPGFHHYRVLWGLSGRLSI